MVCSDCSYVLFEPRESQQRPFNTMSAALICKKFSRNPSKFHFPWKQNLSSRQKALKPETLLTLKVSQYRKSGSTSSGSEPVAASSDCCWLGIRIYKKSIKFKRLLLEWRSRKRVFLLARPACLSCAKALPKELGHCYCSQNLRLSSGLTFDSDCQVSSIGLNLDSNLNSAA